MTNKESRQARQREKLKTYLDYDEVFSFEHLYVSARKCFKGVMWKSSTQKYREELLLNVYETYETLKNREFKSKGFFEFDIVERGKPRHIQSVHISERVIQRCLCDYSLVPVLSNSFIYDNGACLEGKGIDFTLDRLKEHLRKYYRTYGTEGYVLKFDFSKYFENISHEKLKEILHEKFAASSDLEKILFDLIDDFGEKGLGLGSQISQVCALAYPSKIDHFMKEKMRVKFYGRYMDDGYMISDNKEHLQSCLEELKRLCDDLNITLNPKKTMIIKLSKGVPFLKRRFVLTKTGKVLELPQKRGLKKARRRQKKLKEKYPPQTAYKSYVSWKGHADRMNCHYFRHRMNILTGGTP